MEDPNLGAVLTGLIALELSELRGVSPDEQQNLRELMIDAFINKHDKQEVYVPSAIRQFAGN